MKREITDFLKMNDVEYKEDYRLSLISPIKIGGSALFVAYPSSADKLIKLVAFLEKAKIRYKILGRMSNVLPPDDGFDGVIIRTDRICDFSIRDKAAVISCGCSIPHISSVLCRAGLSGFEGISGIPGSIGGAIVGNAGAFGREISDILTSVYVYLVDSDLCINLTADQCNFSYRSSSLLHNGAILLHAEFSLKKSNYISVKEEMDRCKTLRMSTQPYEFPSLGSTFKRPSVDTAAARLIDDCKLKGCSVGGAQVSEKHAGFIINIGGATAADYLNLSNHVAETVFKRFGVQLIREVEAI